MKALIFNSGLGSRLGELTADKPKSMVRLANGESIFHRQLRILYNCGIREFVVTTGPYAEQLEHEVASFQEHGCSIVFVPNPVYDKTNYIYSMFLAREYLRDDDILMLHGDLVFDAAYAQEVIDSPLSSLGSVNETLPQPEKDFKARIVDGEVCEVSVSIFDDDCYAFQPFYKLSRAAASIWIEEVERFVYMDIVGVYAENAANNVFDRMHVAAFSYEGHCVEEIDTPEDLERVSAMVRLYDFTAQPIYSMDERGISLIDGQVYSAWTGIESLPDLMEKLGMTRPLVIASSAFKHWNIAQVLDDTCDYYEVFQGFKPNPAFPDIQKAVAAYKAAGCDSIISAGGGSAIDIAKCVKQMLALPEGSGSDALTSKPLPYADIPHIAMPSTAGTGSESTHFAVCYIDAVKYSIANDCLLPDAVLLDPSVLEGLSQYQKRATMLDALCQAIESYWSAKSSAQSRDYSCSAISSIMDNYKDYLAGDAKAAAKIMEAANKAGHAINLTTTTAPHAMSYKLTSYYHLPHGHAVAVCMPYCWQYLIEHADEDISARLIEIAHLMTGYDAVSAQDALDAFNFFYESLSMPVDWKPQSTVDAEVLASSVNAQRLSNFPVSMTHDDIVKLYEKILSRDDGATE